MLASEMSTAHKFELPRKLDRATIEMKVAFSVIATQMMKFENSTEAMDKLAYSVLPANDKSGTRVIIDVSSDAGRHMAKVFYCYMVRLLGKDGFKVTGEIKC